MSSPNASSAPPSIGMGIVTVVLTLVGWASVPLFLRHYADLIDPWTSNGWRYGFSALLWLPVLIVAGRRDKLPANLWRAAIVPSIVNAAGQVCFAWAHYKIDPALLTFGLRSQLLFVAIGAWMLFPRERAIIGSVGYLIGAGLLVMGMIGVLLTDSSGHAAPVLVHAESAARNTTTGHWQGIGLAVASGLLFACYGLGVRKYMDGMNPVLAFAAICQYTAIVMVALMLALGARHGLTVLDMQGSEIAKLLLSAVIGIAVGHVFYYISIARLGVALTAGVLQLQPFIVAIGSLTLFHEELGPWQWAGGCIAVAGAMLMLSVQWRISQRLKAIEEPLAIAEGEAGA